MVSLPVCQIPDGIGFIPPIPSLNPLDSWITETSVESAGPEIGFAKQTDSFRAQNVLSPSSFMWGSNPTS